MRGDPIWNTLRGPSLLDGNNLVDRANNYLGGIQVMQEMPRGQPYLDRLELDELFKMKDLAPIIPLLSIL